MLTYTPIRTSLVIAFCGLFVMLSALSVRATDDVFKESRELRKRAEKTFGEVNKYVSQLDETERALSSVGRASSGNLRKRYESFSKELDNLIKEQERATSSIDKMRSAGMEYFSAWDKANGRISDPDLRSESSRRRSRILEKHRQFADGLSEIEIELQPFMRNLRDLKEFLGADLTVENVDKAKEGIEGSNMNADVLKEKIKRVRKMLEQFLKDTVD